jgi:hypothetical protein
MIATVKLIGSITSIIAAAGSLASVAGVALALFRVKQVHVIVNSANTELRKEVKTMVRALVAGGIRIPNTPDDDSAA